MKRIEKTRLTKSQLLAIILSGVLLVLLVTAIVLPLALANKKNGGGSTKPPSYREDLGESTYLGALLAYPRVEESKITSILVKNANGSFDMTKVKGNFWLGYTAPGENGETVWEQYIPPILDAENGISYSDLYAIEGGDGYGTIYLLSYLCNAIGAPFFTQRIEFNQDKNNDGFADADTDRDGTLSDPEKEALLSVYGLGKDNPNRISFSYATGVANRVVIEHNGEKYLDVDLALDGEYAVADSGAVVVVKSGEAYMKETVCEDDACADGKHLTKKGDTLECEALGIKVTLTENRTHHIETGSPAINGQGYYFRTDNRECIYYTNTSSLGYGLRGFHEFIKGTVIAAGLPSDYAYEPLLTTGFKAWENTYHKDGAVTDGSNVIVKGDALTAIKESVDFKPATGYKEDLGVELNFDLDELKALLNDKSSTKDNYDRLRDALVGLTIGERTDPVYITMINSGTDSDAMLINFGDKTAVSYTYSVTAIEAVLDKMSGGTMKEVAEDGTPVGDSTLVKITYGYAIDGVTQNTVSRHAVIDLDSDLIPDTARAAIRAASVGALATPIVFEVEYTKDNAVSSTEEFVVTDIVGIFTKDGSGAEKVGEESYVSIRYTRTVDGKAGKKESGIVYIPDLRRDEKLQPLADMLLGRSREENVKIVAYSDTYYREALSDFETYVINNVKGFVTSELTVAFRFDNPSERDPFYGESIYENETDSKLLYGLNANVCEGVIRRLGGLMSGSSTHSAGLSGTTVAVGLTHENMEKYGLYAYTVYFELPRDIYDVSSGTVKEDDDTSVSDELNDWGWHSTLGFTLHVCDNKDEEHLKSGNHTKGKRCVGSDMYGIVAQVDEASLEFLDYEFVDFWARRSLVMVDVYDIEDFKIEFSMKDVYGSYDFDIVNSVAYIGMYNGKNVVSTAPFTTDSGAEAKEVDYFKIYAEEGAGSMKTGLSQYLEATYGSGYQAEGNNKGSIAKLYDMIMGGGEQLFLENSIETVGASNFMLALEITQSTYYTGTLSAEEQAAGLATGEKCMTMKIKLDQSNPNAKPYYYVYEFYRVSGNRVMVATYQEDSHGTRVSGVVSDFYLSVPAFKKIVYGYLSVLNAESVRYDEAYPDEVK